MYKRRRLSRASVRRQILNLTRAQKVGPRGTAESKAFFGEDLASANDSQKLHRYQYRFKGKGRYNLARFLRDAGALGEGIKKTYNSWVPKQIRDQAIGIASSKLASLGGSGLYTGRGAYYANELVAGGAPSMQLSGPGDETESITISNREYITDVYAPSSSDFVVNGVKLNPGLQANFPWLSQVAINYEEYEFEKLLFFFRSTIDIGNANTSGQSGTVIMACDYNASHPLFPNKESMMQYHGAISGKCTDDITCGIECDYSKTADLAQFVRSGPVPTGEDVKTYDLGIFQFAVNNCPSAMFNQQIGELWCEYTIKLRVPKLAVTRGLAQQKDQFISATSTGCSNSAVFGSLSTNLLSNQQNNIGTLVSYSTASFPPSATYAATGWTGTGVLPTLYSPYILNYTAASGNLLITLPAALNGQFTLRLNLCNQGAGALYTGFTPAILFYGTVRPVVDMYKSSAVATGFYNTAYYPSTGTSGAFSCMNIVPGSSVVSPLAHDYYLEIHFSVAAAVGGVNNMILIGTTTIACTDAFVGAQLCIEEMNPSFASTYSNSSGVVTVPTS